MAAMNRPRPFLTAACFVLFVIVFVSINGKSGGCARDYLAEAPSLQQIASGAMQVLRAATGLRAKD